ncbi:hypothetical protein AAHA92_24289 [Salvia divinorum]|uniref:Uncharacterized protein n=1 Tax=Salvia divinorum TaxID=28513 RepID=A0ABD1G6W3_SALDI
MKRIDNLCRNSQDNSDRFQFVKNHYQCYAEEASNHSKAEHYPARVVTTSNSSLITCKRNADFCRKCLKLTAMNMQIT